MSFSEVYGPQALEPVFFLVSLPDILMRAFLTLELRPPQAENWAKKEFIGGAYSSVLTLDVMTQVSVDTG